MSSHRQCRHQCSKKYFSGRACRVSLWRDWVAKLAEAGTTGNGQPTTSLVFSRNPLPLGRGGCQELLALRTAFKNLTGSSLGFKLPILLAGT